MTHKEILSKIDWEVKKQERFLNLVGRANRMKPKDREAVLKNACWVDGTVEVLFKEERKTAEGL